MTEDGGFVDSEFPPCERSIRAEIEDEEEDSKQPHDLTKHVRDSGLLSSDVLKDIQDGEHGCQSTMAFSEEGGSLEEMRQLRDDARTRQSAIDEIERENMLEDGGNEKEVKDAIRVQNIARSRAAASVVYQQVKEERGQEDSEEEDEEEDSEEERERAAVSIQRVQRGRKARKKAREAAVKERKRKEAAAAVKLQSVARGRADRKTCRKKKLEKEIEDAKRHVASSTIQEHFHKRKSMLEYEADVAQRYPFFTSDRPADSSLPMLKIKEFQKSPDQRSLKFQYDCIGGQGAIWLGAALRQNASLRELNLRGNYICDLGAKLVAKGIMSNINLTSLTLAWNSISDKGAMDICLALAKSFSLRTLDLSYNRIADLGAEGLALAIDCNPVLLYLDLEGNPLSWHSAKWVSTACTKASAHLHLNLKDIHKSKKGIGYEAMVDGFFESNLPDFLKEAFWPTFRQRWGILASQPLPKSRGQPKQNAELPGELSDTFMEARVKTGLAARLAELPKQPTSDEKMHSPGVVPGPCRRRPNKHVRSRTSSELDRPGSRSSDRPGTGSSSGTGDRPGSRLSDRPGSRLSDRSGTGSSSGTADRPGTGSSSGAGPRKKVKRSSTMKATSSCPDLPSAFGNSRPSTGMSYTPPTTASSGSRPGTVGDGASLGGSKRSSKVAFAMRS